MLLVRAFSRLQMDCAVVYPLPQVLVYFLILVQLQAFQLAVLPLQAHFVGLFQPHLVYLIHELQRPACLLALELQLGFPRFALTFFLLDCVNTGCDFLAE